MTDFIDNPERAFREALDRLLPLGSVASIFLDVDGVVVKLVRGADDAVDGSVLSTGAPFGVRKALTEGEVISREAAMANSKTKHYAYKVILKNGENAIFTNDNNYNNYEDMLVGLGIYAITTKDKSYPINAETVDRIERIVAED